MEKYEFDKKGIENALKKVGVKKGDVVFSHVGMGFMGEPKEGGGLNGAFKTVFDAFMSVLGDGGTWFVPTYTYSFCKGEDYDVQNSPSTVGYFTEIFRKQPGVKRSLEPIFSVAGIGPRVDEFFSGLPTESFGEGSIYDRLHKADAAICNVGVGFRYATYIHYVEKKLNVPYRFDKIFSGDIVDGKKRVHSDFTYYVRSGIDDATTFPDLSELERAAVKADKVNYAEVGRGRLSYAKCRDIFNLAKAGFEKDPYFLAKGAKTT